MLSLFQVNTSLALHLSTLQQSVGEQVSQLHQKVLEQSESGVTETLVNEMVTTQVEKVGTEQLADAKTKWLKEVRCTSLLLRLRLHGDVFTRKRKLLFAYTPFVYTKTVKTLALSFSF